LKNEAVSAVVSERDTKWKTAIMKQYKDMSDAIGVNTDKQKALKDAQDALKKAQDASASAETIKNLEAAVTAATTVADKAASDLLIAQNKLRVVAAAAKAKNMPACPKVTSSRQNAEIGVGVSLGVLLLLFMVFFFMSRSKVKGLKRQLAKMGGGLELTPSAVTPK
jgi:flagellar biosynthesis/type III secretory pathway M-ring protein FliF/YscJ